MRVILVDENNHVIGQEEKLLAHQEGLLHRAFSVMVYRDNQLLFQKRSKEKYHSASLWSNTCCSHPLPEESLEDAVRRRMQEEMGFNCSSYTYSGKSLYKLALDNNLIEHELDHIFMGKWEEDLRIRPSPLEVSDYRWITLEEWKKEYTDNPQSFTQWLPYVMGWVEKFLNSSTI